MSVGDVVDKLERLVEMHDSGLLDVDQFEAAKNQLLLTGSAVHAEGGINPGSQQSAVATEAEDVDSSGNSRDVEHASVAPDAKQNRSAQKRDTGSVTSGANEDRTEKRRSRDVEIGYRFTGEDAYLIGELEAKVAARKIPYSRVDEWLNVDSSFETEVDGLFRALTGRTTGELGPDNPELVAPEVAIGASDSERIADSSGSLSEPALGAYLMQAGDAGHGEVGYCQADMVGLAASTIESALAARDISSDPAGSQQNVSASDADEDLEITEGPSATSAIDPMIAPGNPAPSLQAYQASAELRRPSQSPEAQTARDEALLPRDARSWRPGWRKMTWLIVIFNGLMLVWLVAGLGGAADNCEGETVNREACEAGTAVGAALGIGILIFLWVMGSVILGILWLVTDRRSER